MSTPYDYYPAVLYAINELGQGHTLSQACDLANISVALFKSYCARDPQLQEMFVEAEQRSYDALADALVNIDNHKIHGQNDPKMAAVISKNIQWFLSKKDPKRFGERMTVEHDVKVDVLITSALQRAKQRISDRSGQDEIVDAVIVPPQKLGR